MRGGPDEKGESSGKLEQGEEQEKRGADNHTQQRQKKEAEALLSLRSFLRSLGPFSNVARKPQQASLGFCLGVQPGREVQVYYTDPRPNGANG